MRITLWLRVSLTYGILQYTEDSPFDVCWGGGIDVGELMDEVVVDGQETQVEVQTQLDALLRPLLWGVLQEQRTTGTWLDKPDWYDQATATTRHI